MKRKVLYALLLMGCSAFNPVDAQTPPATWQEHWFEHNQLLTRKFYDNDVAVYYDNDVSTSVTWPYQYMGDVWRYTKKTYGWFGADPHLFVVMHTNKYSGGHPSGYFDASHDNRDVADVGPGPWTSASGGDHDLLTHEVGHIVEGDSKNAHNSPAFGIWGDSKWAEIYIYDVYQGLGMTSDAARVYTTFTNTTDNFPATGTHWFRDWFYPIYSQYGGSKVLNRYFVLLSSYFPKSGSDYARSLNMGEFIHFWSAAAGVSLKSQATTAFGWNSTYESQFNQAQLDFPITYAPVTIAAYMYQDINYGGYGISLPVGSYNLTALKAYGAINDDITSVKVTPGYKVTLYADDNFSGASLVLTSDVSLLDVSTWNDKVSSAKVEAITAAAAEKESADLTVYPNPVLKGGTLTVNVGKYDGKEPVYVSVIDVNKKVVAERKDNAARIALEVRDLPAGVYVVVVTNGRKSYTKKIVIQ